MPYQQVVTGYNENGSPFTDLVYTTQQPDLSGGYQISTQQASPDSSPVLSVVDQSGIIVPLNDIQGPQAAIAQ